MSTTYELLCRDCKQTLWIAQSSCGIGHVYTEPRHAKALYDFLSAHLNHHLQYVTSENVPLDYEEIDDGDSD
jgi:hypothetical protein